MTVRRIAVIGGGTMGRGIAQVAATSGHETTLRDVDDAALRAARKAIEGNLDKGVEKGKLTREQADAALARLRTSKDLWEACSKADLVIEAVPEDLGIKRRLFADLDDIVPASAILATNTSSLSPAAVAQGTKDAGRVVGMHFFNPAHVLPLVEIVRHPGTRDDVVDAVLAVARTMGKEPIVVRDAPGFASTRLGIALGMEAIRMLEQGVATAADIDKAMELGYQHPMGPLKLTDLVGLDVRLAIAEHLARELGPRFEPPQLLRAMVAQGRLGRKAGRGFYDYPA